MGVSLWNSSQFIQISVPVPKGTFCRTAGWLLSRPWPLLLWVPIRLVLVLVCGLLICCMCPSFSDHWTSSCSACAQQSPVLQEAEFSSFVLPSSGSHPHCSEFLILNALWQVMQQVQRTCSVGIVWTSAEETKQNLTF